MRTLKCICVFECPSEKRRYFLSSNEKFRYIIGVLNKLGFKADVVSASVSLERSGFWKQREDKIDCVNKVVSGVTFGTRTALGHVLQKVVSLMWLFFYLLKNCKSNETILVYHSVIYTPVLFWVKKIKHIKLCLEVEEIHYEISFRERAPKWRVWLENLMINQADSFIFASQQLADRCNPQNKPYAIANGRYIAEPIMAKPDEDNLIHIIYAGLIKKSMVAFNCLNIADYLPSNYRLHIIGYGEDVDIKELERIIDEKNKKNDCKIVYDGVKRDNEYKIYLQKCHIGICPLPSSASLQSACFPSKITSYLANGLRVVTTENKVVRASAYGKIITFCKDELPENFASIIKSINIHAPYDSRKLIEENNQLFISQIKSIL